MSQVRILLGALSASAKPGPAACFGAAIHACDTALQGRSEGATGGTTPWTLASNTTADWPAPATIGAAQVVRRERRSEETPALSLFAALTYPGEPAERG